MFCEFLDAVLFRALWYVEYTYVFSKSLDVKNHLYVIFNKWPVLRIISGMGKIVCTTWACALAKYRYLSSGTKMIKHNMLFGSLPRGYSWFQVTGMIEWGQKYPPPPKKKSLNQNLTPKKSHAEFPSHKNFQKRPGYGNYHESSDCFEDPKISLHKSSCPKILAKIFLSKRNPEIETYPSIILVTWNPEYPPGSLFM